MSLKNNNLILLALLIAGCKQMPQISVPTLPGLGAHKIDIQQGNVVTQEMLDKLQPGMTRNQVRFVLGTPLLVDPFRTDRWDYFYSMKKRGELVEQRQLKVFFQDDKMVRYEGDVATDTKPGAGAVAAAKPAAKPAEKPVAVPVAKPEPVIPAPSQSVVATPAVQPEIAKPVVPSAPAREAVPTWVSRSYRWCPAPGEPAKPEDLKPPVPVVATQREPEGIVAPPLEAPPLPRLVIPPERTGTVKRVRNYAGFARKAAVVAQPEAKPVEKPATGPGFFGRLFSRSPSQPVQPSAALVAKPDVPAKPAAGHLRQRQFWLRLLRPRRWKPQWLPNRSKSPLKSPWWPSRKPNPPENYHRTRIFLAACSTPRVTLRLRRAPLWW